MIKTESTGTEAFASLSPAVWRASTVVFPSLDAFISRKQRLPDGFTYGTTGTPTQRALEARIAALDSKGLDVAAHCVVFPSGQAAFCNTLLAFLKAGDHLLMTESAYGPAKVFATQHLSALGVQVELYDPAMGAAIANLIQPHTRMVWMESPGTITMEMQDVPDIATAARARGVLTAIDNTWASPLGFAALAHGVDLCIHACTKYMGGHSDVLMGSVSAQRADLYATLRGLQAVMGQAVGAEDCFLVARGLDTLHVRLERQASSALTIAQQLCDHSEVAQVLFPALPSSPDHALWARDFSNPSHSGCLMSVLLHDAPIDAYRAMFAKFKLFSIGASWGGVHSVVGFYPESELAQRRFSKVRGAVVRLSVGLEDPKVLIDELHLALHAFKQARGG